jgi:hypothetical protein
MKKLARASFPTGSARAEALTRLLGLHRDLDSAILALLDGEHDRAADLVTLVVAGAGETTRAIVQARDEA